MFFSDTPQAIKNLLNSISRQHKIEIIFALECGSRAYGLNSDSSDYDIRFVYIHKDKTKYEEYFEAQSKYKKAILNRIDIDFYREIDEKTFTGKLVTNRNNIYDWHGWDITKAIQHLKEMNPSLVEWIYSPIVYLNDPKYDFLNKSKNLLRSQNRVLPLIMHYKSMARKHYEDYMHKQSQVRIKKYLVMVRSCGMIKWLLNCKEHDDDIEIDFIDVIEDIRPFISRSLLEEIYYLIDEKKESEDSCEAINRIRLLDDWILDSIETESKSFQRVKLKEADVKEPENPPYSNYLFKCINY